MKKHQEMRLEKIMWLAIIMLVASSILAVKTFGQLNITKRLVKVDSIKARTDTIDFRSPVKGYVYNKSEVDAMVGGVGPAPQSLNYIRLYGDSSMCECQSFTQFEEPTWIFDSDTLKWIGNNFYLQNSRIHYRGVDTMGGDGRYGISGYAIIDISGTDVVTMRIKRGGVNTILEGYGQVRAVTGTSVGYMYFYFCDNSNNSANGGYYVIEFNNSGGHSTMIRYIYIKVDYEGQPFERP